MNINELNNFVNLRNSRISAPKTFSAYGMNSLNDIHRSSEINAKAKMNRMSEKERAFALAKEIHDREREEMSQNVSKAKKDTIVQLGGEEINASITEKIEEAKAEKKIDLEKVFAELKQKQKVETIKKSDEEIQSSLNKAKEDNKKVGMKLDTNSSMEDIINELF